ncbi:MAG: FliM/FliN family flagellar motor switch protein [Phycisphaerales bacterium]|nr:FliM/FliN family flagellar motor switch protein [Phycisphaerales bacterium]
MPATLSSLLRLEVPLIVRIADRKMKMGEVLNLAPGAIIEMPRAADEELDILANNKLIGSGRVVKVGENFGIRITAMGDVESRVAALGPSDETSADVPDEADESAESPSDG